MWDLVPVLMISGQCSWLEETNEAGRELLSFLAINEATVCNTWFSKRDT